MVHQEWSAIGFTHIKRLNLLNLYDKVKKPQELWQDTIRGLLRVLTKWSGARASSFKKSLAQQAIYRLVRHFSNVMVGEVMVYVQRIFLKDHNSHPLV